MTSIPRIVLSGILAFSAISAGAAVITPQYDAFGSLPAANFGGTGIPNNAVATTTLANATLGLTAHQRYSNTPVTNDGAGTYSAEAGGDTLNGAPGLARWNIGIFVDQSTATADYAWRFYYDTNPAVGNDVSTYIPSPGGSYQNSLNLGFSTFDFFGNTNGINFNPEAPGEYGFALALVNGQGTEVARTSILVNARSNTAVPDGGFTLALLGCSLTAVGLLKRKMA